MSTQQIQQKPTSIKGLFSETEVRERFTSILGKNSQTFVSSVIQVSANDKYLSKSDPNTILTAAITAAVLGLSINPNLGDAYIISYAGKAAFQIGYKGIIQLSIRSNYYETINVTTVYANQLNSFDYLSEELDGDFSKDGEGEPIGYMAYFKLHNGFKKRVYWTVQKVKYHAQKYSKSFNDKYSAWNTNFNGMALKTVIKYALDKYGPKSVEMQMAILADSSVQHREGEYSYPDNEGGMDEITILTNEEKEQKEQEDAWMEKLDKATSLEDFANLGEQVKIIQNAVLKAFVRTKFLEALGANGFMWDKKKQQYCNQ